MDGLEKKLSALLHQAPGDPPVGVDADAFLTRAGRRRRYLAAVPVAAAVLVLAVVVTVATNRTGTSRPAAPDTSVSSQPSTPEAEAMQLIDAAFAAAALPPGAVRVDHELPMTGQFSTSTSPNEVRRTGWWTAPGTVADVADYISSHRPTDMTVESSGSFHSTTTSAAGQTYDFATKAKNGGYALELDYVIASYQSGVAIRVDTWTVWAPIRPQWSYVPASVTAVDVTVVRSSRTTGSVALGAPTIRRTLTADAARTLAADMNRLPAVAPDGVHSCPAPLLEASDDVVFHTPAGDLRMTKSGTCSSGVAVTSGQSPADTVFVRGTDFDKILLSALGLPQNYGYN
jgi:hypothetical protein